MGKLKLKSEQMILGDMISTIITGTGINDLNPGSIILALLTAAAREDYQQYYQMLQIVRNYNIDTTTGTDLENRAFEYGLERQEALRATGKISILQAEGFVKVSSTQYTGVRSRIAGDTEIFLNDAENFPDSGSNTLIIGRGTPNEEEVTYTGSASNPENNTNFFKIILDAPMTNDHAQEEEVVLKQGVDVTIGAGTVVRVPATATTEEIQFTLTRDATLLAGEDRVDDVDIQATQLGAKSNIAVNAITGTEAFIVPPFTDARAENTSPFSNGRDRETDTALRNRIKAHIQGISQSTQGGISDAINGLVDSDTAKRVVSSNIILPDNVGLPVKVYIDDSTGFEPSFEAQGQETIIASAVGGETRLQLDLFPLVKAQLETLNAEPYDFSTNGLTLNLNVGPDTETITFFSTDFVIPEAGTAEEVVAAINNAANLIEARTSQTGTKVVINAKSDTNEEIQVTGGTANTELSFPTELVETFYLYKNDVKLSKDGETAFVESSNSSPYDFSGPDRDLSITVDGKTSNTQTVTISESDFESPAAAAQATAQQIADIINAQLSGAVADDANGQVRITSNTELSIESKIKINTSDANTVLSFPTDEIVGRDQDYTLNPELGVIELVEPLEEFDTITAGTRSTRAFLQASIPGDYSFAGGETLDVRVDGATTELIVFSAAANITASQVASVINSQAIGFTAESVTIGSSSFVRLRTNTQDISGSLEVLSSSTANPLFEFETDVLKANILSHVAYQTSNNSGPYAFLEGHTLVVVLDNDPSGKTFVITMDFDSVVTSGTSTTEFGASLLSSVFESDDELNDSWVVFKSGDNTITGDIVAVENPLPNVFRYVFDSPPTNFEDFEAGDQATFTDLTESVNNGVFLVEDVSVQNAVLGAVEDKDLDTPPAGPSVGDRYIVADTANTVVSPNNIIDKDLDTPPGGPTPGDRYIIASGANDTQLDPVLEVIPSSSLATTTHNFRYLIDRSGITDRGTVISIENDDTGLDTSLGSRYLVGTSPVNGFAGRANQIAEGNGGGFTFSLPATDDEIYVTAEAQSRYFSGSAWDVDEWATHASQIAQYNGVGTPGWTYITPNDEDVVEDLNTSDIYQFDSGGGTWVLNPWGGSASKVTEWDGAAWLFTTPLDDEVRNVLDEATKYQYDLGTNTWAENEWGGEATKIAEWGGANWIFTTANVGDVTNVIDESQDYIFDGGSWDVFQFWIEVENDNGAVESGSTGTGLIGQRRQILTYVNNGAITLVSPLRSTPVVNDEMIVLPGTRENVKDFFNNTKITSLSASAYIELAEDGSQIQISSKKDGSDGYVQITGGQANEILQFSTTLIQGIQAYSYYIGLIKLVHKTIYGDETDLVAFPGVGAAGVKFQVLPPTTQQVGFSVEVALSEGTSLSNVENDVKSAIISYIQTLGVSEEVVVAKVIEAVLSVTGVIDVNVETPTENIVIAANELARTKASLISVGQI